MCATRTPQPATRKPHLTNRHSDTMSKPLWKKTKELNKVDEYPTTHSKNSMLTTKAAFGI